ncbi:Flagellar hook-associated protein 2 [Botrimarina colliarenosi]|uniref:Filament cap protein n=1 Tax=Botrimarina colliarenosi TaxID=2528001 RepID=A0A5C6AJD6_9BACT|nr:flagellar filament capping protein FliD [Botrimarina colliarenosi]TWT99358.1 Flagellar hook-associated protein 2 [Botrimarina colliarenosi]
MSRISSTGITTSSGLITGIPIEETVNQLLSIAARPRATLQNRTDSLKAEQTAVDQLSSLVLGLRFSLSGLDRNQTFASRSVKSADPAAVTVAVQTGATPAAGSYQLTPLRAATSHQVVSGSIGDLSDALGSGDLELRFGGRVNKGVSLTDINGGAGFAAGKIKITDRAGDTATIDLRAATTIDEVLNEINSSDEIDVTASIDGDQIVLTDNTGEAGVFRVREVGGGTTAESLGLAGLTGSTDTLTGGDIFGITGSTKLASLNDGLGVAVNELKDIDDLFLTLADGTTAGFDLSDARTVGDVLTLINDNEDLDGRVTVSIDPDGNRLRITDNTTGSETFTVEGSAADDLGLDKASTGGVVTGDRLIAGLGGVLLASLNGGQGIEAGSIELTNRDGATATVDLSAAETLDDVIGAINAAGIDITARVNNAGTGLLLTDASGGAGSLIVAESSGGSTAASLGLLAEEGSNTFDSGALNRRTVGLQTKLSTFRGGEGIARGQIRLTDSAGKGSTIDLRFSGVDNPTLGDVIAKINASAVEVTASLNEAGDGLLLTDTAGGEGKLSVTEVAGGATAAQLRILGESSVTNGDNQQTIDGTSRFSVNLSEITEAAGETPLTALNGGSGVDHGLVTITNSQGAGKTVDLRSAVTVQDVIDKINDADAGVTAALNSAGTGIELTDTAGGTGKLKVVDLTGSAAEDLKIAGESSKTNGTGQQTISGAGLIGSGEPLELLAKRINDFDAGFEASVVFDGAGYRLAISSSSTGAANEIVVSAGSTSLSFTETSRAADAVAVFGQGALGGVSVTSSNGKFNDVIDGVNITVNQANGDPVKIDVAQNDDPLRTSINGFVAAYNSVRTNLDTVTDYDADTLTTGILFGRNEAVRVDSDLSRLASGRFTTGSRYTSLESIGISLDAEGKLAVNSTKLNAALAEDHGAVERLFRDEDTGVVARFTDATDRLAGDESSLLSARSISLTNTIDSNETRIEFFTASLEQQRDRLLLSFYKLEETVSLLQSNLDTVSSIQPITIANSSN